MAEFAMTRQERERPVNRSDEELAMRAMMDAEMRYLYPSARIIHELALRYCSNSIDLTAVTQDKIIGVEIKSSRDTLERLEKQITAFAPICSLVFVAVAPKHFDAAQSIALRDDMPNVIVETCCAMTGRVVVDPFWMNNKSRRQRPWSYRQLGALRVAELHQIAFEHRLHCPSRHDLIVDALCDKMTGNEVMRAVCDTLRRRVSPNVMSDEPIGSSRSAPKDLIASDV